MPSAFRGHRPQLKDIELFCFALELIFHHGYEMSVQEIEAQVTQLTPEQLKAFSAWFEEFIASAWDRKFESDVAAGKLDHLAERADADFEAGRCTPL